MEEENGKAAMVQGLRTKTSRERCSIMIRGHQREMIVGEELN